MPARVKAFKSSGKAKPIVFAFLIAALIFCLLPESIYASAPKADIKLRLEDYVEDRAAVLDDEVIEHIRSINRDLEAATKAQIAVLTVNQMQDYEISDLANAVFAATKLGGKEEMNGALILLYVNQGLDPIHNKGKGQVFIEVGYGAEGFLNDAKVGRIIDDKMLDDLSEQRWSEAVRKGFDAVTAAFLKEYEIDELGSVKAEKGDDMGAAILVFIIILVIALYRFRNSSGYRGGGFHGPRGGGFTGRSFGSGGGFSGGGGGFSGGGGGFSGGGGSSGGGGAGRSF